MNLIRLFVESKLLVTESSPLSSDINEVKKSLSLLGYLTQDRTLSDIDGEYFILHSKDPSKSRSIVVIKNSSGKYFAKSMISSSIEEVSSVEDILQAITSTL